MSDSKRGVEPKPPGPDKRKRRTGSSRRRKDSLGAGSRDRSYSASTGDLSGTVSLDVPDSGKSSGLFRSFSDRRKRKSKAKAEAKAAEGGDGMKRSESTGGLSFRSLSFKRKKKKKSAIEGEASDAPDSPKGRGTFFRRTLKGKKKKKEEPQPVVENFAKSASRSEFFKSKKVCASVPSMEFSPECQGDHLWAERYGVADVHLETVALKDLLPQESAALTVYAVYELSDMLRNPVALHTKTEKKKKGTLSHRLLCADN